MATSAEEAAKKVAPAPAPGVARRKREKVKKNPPTNYDLGNGLYRFSRTKMFHKTAKYKLIGKKNEKKVKPRKPTFIEKPIGGEKNGGTRIVLLKKRKNYYSTAKRIRKHPSKKCFSQHTRYTRPTLTPGTICILLAGLHRGKRVVLLKVLKTGLLLVTGPFKVNGCPMRRISQNYVIATRTKVDISSVTLPEHINDECFKRKRQKRPKKEEGDIFATKKEAYKASEQRKTDQKEVDRALIKAIKKQQDGGLLLHYLSTMFGLGVANTLIV